MIICVDYVSLVFILAVRDFLLVLLDNLKCVRISRYISRYSVVWLILSDMDCKRGTLYCITIVYRARVAKECCKGAAKRNKCKSSYFKTIGVYNNYIERENNFYPLLFALYVIMKCFASTCYTYFACTAEAKISMIIYIIIVTIYGIYSEFGTLATTRTVSLLSTRKPTENTTNSMLKNMSFDFNLAVHVIIV